MTGEARTFMERLRRANLRKLSRWTFDRAAFMAGRLAWHAACLRMQAQEAFALRGQLPPGSLSASCWREAHLDDQFYLKGFRRHGPIFKLFWRSGDLKICILGYRLARRLLQENHGRLHPVTIDLTPLVPNEYLRAMDPKIHPHYRSLFVSALRSEVTGACEPQIRSLIKRELTKLMTADASMLATRLHDALDRTAIDTLLMVIMGVPPDAECAVALRAAFKRLGPDGYVAPIGAEQRIAFSAIRAVVLSILESAASNNALPSTDSVLGRLAVTRGERIDDTVIGNAIYMVERGRHDLRDLLRWIIKHLSDHPEFVTELRAELSTPKAHSPLAEACVLETLRLEQAELLVRKALVPFRFLGYQIPKGSWVCTMLRETHRDPKVFPDPETYRPHRFVERHYSTNEYAPFGLDEHQCIGRSLTLRVGAMLVEELVGGFSWTVTADGPRQFGQLHWQPSPSFAIALRPLAGAAPFADGRARTVSRPG